MSQSVFVLTLRAHTSETMRFAPNQLPDLHAVVGQGMDHSLTLDLVPEVAVVL